jgi:hypothetical protein
MIFALCLAMLALALWAGAALGDATAFRPVPRDESQNRDLVHKRVICRP